MSGNSLISSLDRDRSDVIMNFSGQVTTSSTYLAGSGGQAGDGLPLPCDARIYRVDCWDGAISVNNAGNLKVSQGDRISVYANSTGGAFDVKVRVNGIDTAMVAVGVNINSTFFVSVHLQLLL